MLRRPITVAITLALALTAMPLAAQAETGRHAVETGTALDRPVPLPRPSRDMQAEQDLVGAKVISNDNKISGKIEKIVVRDGIPQAVTAYGGLLGLGNAWVTLPLADLEPVGAGIARVRISDAQVRQLPRYEG